MPALFSTSAEPSVKPSGCRKSAANGAYGSESRITWSNFRTGQAHEAENRACTSDMTSGGMSASVPLRFFFHSNTSV